MDKRVEQPVIEVADGHLVCKQCGKPADTLHYLYGDKVWRAACPNHDPDPGGYWIRVNDLVNEPLKWFAHLFGKGDNRLSTLIKNLGPEGLYCLHVMSQKNN